MKRAKLVLSHRGTNYEINHNLKFDDIMDNETIIFLFDEGNLCDDESRADMIRQYCDPIFPQVPPGGDEIELESIEIVNY